MVTGSPIKWDEALNGLRSECGRISRLSEILIANTNTNTNTNTKHLPEAEGDHGIYQDVMMLPIAGRDTPKRHRTHTLVGVTKI
jgi:hypothetical protein